jgi:hypothetical protein
MVCMATTPQAGWPGVRILVGAIFFSSPKCPDRLQVPSSIIFTGYQASFPGLKH